MMTNPFARAFIWLLGQTLEKIWPDIDNGTGYKTKKNGKSRTVTNTRKYAREKLTEGYDIVVCGHDHRIKIERHAGKVYANCGKCQKGKKQGVLLNTLTDEIKIV